MKKNRELFRAAFGGFACFVVVAAAACSSDDSSSSGGGFTCGSVGDRNCPNDTPLTQATVDGCKRCKTEAEAYYACTGGRPQCDATKNTSKAADTSNCKDGEVQKYAACLGGGAPSDAGTGG